MGEDDDGQHPTKTDLPRSPAKSEVHDHTKNRQDARCEDPTEPTKTLEVRFRKMGLRDPTKAIGLYRCRVRVGGLRHSDGPYQSRLVRQVGRFDEQ